MNPSADALVGRVLGGYQLLSVHGTGGTGTVYLAAKVDAPEQQVAVKVLTPPAGTTPADLTEFKARFQREAKALQLLAHPHILSLIAYGEDEQSGVAYMVLPLMAGGTLTSRLSQGGVSLEDAARYASQIADALDYAHDKGIVHRDLKPGNVLLDATGEVFLADFGIAKIFDTAGTTVMTLTSTGQIMGTADYMSPEQAQGQDVTAASDIYSFGMVLYHLITGQVAFEGKSLTQVLLQIATTPPIPPRRLRPTLPSPAEASILKALSKQPIDRFKTAGELAAAFTQGLENQWAPGLRQAATVDTFVPQQTIAQPRDGMRGSTPLTRPPVLIAGVCALLIVAITSALLFAHGPGGPSTQANTGPTATTALTSGTGSPTLTATRAPTATARQSGNGSNGGGSGFGGGGTGSGGGGGQPTPTNTPVPPTPTNTPVPAGTVKEFQVPIPNTDPEGITVGTDGALWFTGFDWNGIGRITLGGSISVFPLPNPTPNTSPWHITSGPDGALWFTWNAANQIGRITTGGSISEFPIPTQGSGAGGITVGPDGALWFGEPAANKIGRITTGGTITEFTVNNGPGDGITSGPDGALWFTERSGAIGRMTTGGTVTEFPIPTVSSDPQAITVGRDGAFWFTEQGNVGKIGRITLGGSISEFPVPTQGSAPTGITSGPDGALWFTESARSQIGRITTGGSFSEFPIPTGTSLPGITTGMDGNLWFTEFSSNQIARMVP